MLTAVAALAFWAGGLVRVRPALAHPDKRPLCLALLALGAGAVFDTPLYSTFDRWAGITNLSDLMAHGLGLVGVFFLLRTLDGLAAPSDAGASPPRSDRWLAPALVVSLAVSAGLFAATPRPVETSAFTAYYGHEPTIGAYWAISIVFPTLCLVQLMRTAITHWSSAVAELRWGLRVVAAGTALGFFYAALKLAEVICQLYTDIDLAAAARTVDLTALGLGLSLIAAGLALTSPAVGGAVVAAFGRVRSRLLLRRLKWLWTTLCLRAGAADVLSAASDADTDPDFQLLRRVVEIRDAQATLWSYLTPSDVEQVRLQVLNDHRDENVDALTAAALAIALERELAGQVDQRRGTEALPAHPIMVSSGPMALSPHQEARELIVVSKLIRKALRARAR